MKLVHKEYVFEEGVPFSECHASTLVRLENGDIVAAWFGGTKEGCDDVMIWCSRREKGSWTSPVCVTTEEGSPHWNPVLFQYGDTTLLFYKNGRHIPYWKTMVMESSDGGRTWSQPRELVMGDQGGRGPVKNKPILASNGMLLAPASIEQGPWRCFIDISADGICWEKKPIPVADHRINMIQPSLWEMPGGHIHALMRSSGGRIYRSDSNDSGETWCPAYLTQIPNNNSGLDCVLTDSGTLALVCNPVEKDWGPRSPLSLFLSDDNGQNFRKAMDLETEPGEFSYPAVIAHENKLHITYTWNRRNICYREIEL